MRDGDGIQSCDRVDPLQGLSGLALFPRTFRELKKEHSKSSKPDDLEAVHESMRSMALKSPNGLVEQAKTIIDGVSELLNTSFSNSVAIEKPNETIDEMGRGNPQERRPALGRKRPRFSLKLNTSQPAASLEPSPDIDKLEDPEDYFLAYEKLENAKKELQRQKASDLNILGEYNPPKAERCRRPGLLGKSASYKHHYSSMSHEKDETFVASQETSELDILSPSNHSSQPETAASNDELQQRDLSGSISETENRVNDLLDQLLSDRCVSLDGAGALSFLQEHLQIKPIDLDKLCLPDFHDVGKNVFLDMKEKLPKPRNVLSDVQNMLKRIGDKTPMKDKPVAGSPINSVASPTPPKSPFASISLLKKSILKSRDLSHDPFTTLNLSPSRNPSIVEHFDQGSDQFDSRMDVNDSGDLESTKNEHVVTVGDRSFPEMIARDSIHPPDKCFSEDLGTLGSSDNLRSIASQSDLDDKDRDSDMEDTVINDHDSRAAADTDILMSRPHEMQENEGDIPLEVVSFGQHDANIIEDSSMLYTDDQTDGPNEMQENVEDPSHNAERDVYMDVPALGTSKSSQIQLGSAAVSLRATDDELSKSSDEAPSPHNENIQRPSMVSPNKQSKAKRPPRAGQRSHALSRRQSLAEAGTSWASGVRRSNRIKMRPLEYWKGERFLYGRVHKSLTTVIGVKYISPAKSDGKPTFRVKSFSDKYNELVELAALH